MVVHQARKNLIDFSIATDPRYQDTWFHETMAIVFQSVLKKVEDGEDARVILTVPPRHGKQCASETLVPTPNGFKKHSELNVGDFVFSLTGKPIKVKAVIPQKQFASLLVTMSNGYSVVVHPNHEWTVYDRRKNTKNNLVTIETKKMMKDVWIGKKNIRGSRARWQLPGIGVIQFKLQEIQVDPYTLGCWLGDGSKGKPCLTLHPNDVENIVSNIPYKISSICKHKTTGIWTIYFSGKRGNGGELTKGLQKLGIYLNKDIPKNYLFNDERVRRELLAGLIDTDGCIGEDKRVRFVNINKKLINNISLLIRSLGYRTTTTSQKASLSSSGIQGKHRVYTVSFTPTDNKFYTYLKRKNDRIGQGLKRRISIVSIEKIEGVKGECIQVENKDGIYLITEGFIPTHNSELATMKFPAWMLGKHPEWPTMVASYSGDLAVDFGHGTREIMQSTSYQQIFKTRLRSDSQAKGKWMTEEGGGYMSAGAGGAITGKGFKVGIVDDIFKNREEAESQTIRDSRWDWWKSTFYTRQEGNTAIIVIGTRWHTDDVIGRLIAKQKEDEANNENEYDKWILVEFPAIAIKDENFRKKGEALWPAKFPINKLRKTENTLGPYEFSALYQCNPITSANQEFKTEWFKSRSWSEVEALDTRKFATIDPGGKGVENDNTGIVRNYIDKQNKWNIKAMGVHFDSKELLNHIFKLHDEGFEKIGIEETVYLKAVKPFYDDECIKLNKFPNIVPIKQPSTQKEVRIRGLIPRYSSGGIYHIENSCKNLEEELVVFPKGAHDDVPDALAMQNDIAEPPIDDYKIALIKARRTERASIVAKRYGI